MIFRSSRSSSSNAECVSASRAGATAPAHGVADLRRFLADTWWVSRVLVDQAKGARGTFLGRAAFDPDGDDLAYREIGTMVFGDYRGAGHRTYRYRFPSPGRAAVSFDDGRPFHDLDLSDGTWRADHLCGADRYQGRFTAVSSEAWLAEWRVTGPRKDLVITGRYLRWPAGCGRDL